MLKIFYLSIFKHLLLTTVLPLIIIMILDTLLYADKRKYYEQCTKYQHLKLIRETP